MNKDELKNRTKSLAIRIVKLVDAMPKTVAGKAISNQIIRSGTSIAANYRAALQARSKAEFISKIGIVLEEADETLFWLELITETGILPQKRLELLSKETKELSAIFCSTLKTSRNVKSQISNFKLNKGTK